MDAIKSKGVRLGHVRSKKGFHAPRWALPSVWLAWPDRGYLEAYDDITARLSGQFGTFSATASTGAVWAGRAQPGTSSRPQLPSRLSAETKQQQRSQPQSPLDATQRRASAGDGSEPSGPGPEPEPGQQPNEPGGPEGGVPFRLRYWILLLAEYGGIYGTAAVAIAALTNIDAFGGLHWDASDVALGLGLMAPALAFDAVVGLPDWTTKQEDAAALVRLFVDPELLQPHPKKQQPKQAETSSDNAASTAAPAATSAATTGGSRRDDPAAPAVVSSSEAPAPAAAVASTSGSGAGSGSGERYAAGSAASASTSGVKEGAAAGSGGSSSSSSSGGKPGALWAAGQRLRMALELMQESSVRNNPGARLTPLQESAVIAVAVSADEMLYRAVLLTLFGRWLRDRFYEAGAEEALALPPGGLLSGVIEVDTAVAAQWVALGIGAALGAAVFATKAWQEATMAQRLRAMHEAEREEAAKALRKQRLLGQHMTEEELREARDKQVRLEAAQASLAASIGVQGALVWVLEGSREVYQVAASGAAFIVTGNLAAPLAGSLAAQVLVSAYQRLGLRRSMQRRAELVARRRAALQRRQEAAAGAGAEVGAEAGEPAGRQEASQDAQTAAAASEGQDQQRQDQQQL